MEVEIDPDSGFCFGVVNAINLAENILKKEGKLYCLGDIVHNNKEVDRLNKLGLISINYNDFKELKNCKVLIRAHGEPPENYNIAKKNNIEIIDGTCPVVLKLQTKIKKHHEVTKDIGGQIVIYGKNGHAEVRGLVGQTDNKAIVVEEISDLNEIDFTKPVYLFAQTTKNKESYLDIFSEIITRIKRQGGDVHSIVRKFNK